MTPRTGGLSTETDIEKALKLINSHGFFSYIDISNIQDVDVWSKDFFIIIEESCKAANFIQSIEKMMTCE